MPAFDLGRKVGRKIAATPHRRAVVLCVVDLADFDGSLPRAALSAIVPRGTCCVLEQTPPSTVASRHASQGLCACPFARLVQRSLKGALHQAVQAWVMALRGFRRVAHFGSQ